MASHDFKVGDRVEVWSASKQAWFQDGEVTQVLGDHTVTVTYDDRKLHKDVPVSEAARVLKKALERNEDQASKAKCPEEPGTQSPAGREGAYSVGDHVVIWSHSKQAWFRDGLVSKVSEDQRITVEYDSRRSNKEISLSEAGPGAVARLDSDARLAEVSDSWWMVEKPVLGSAGWRGLGWEHKLAPNIYQDDSMFHRNSPSLLVKDGPNGNRHVRHLGCHDQELLNEVQAHEVGKHDKVIGMRRVLDLNAVRETVLAHGGPARQDGQGDLPLHVAAAWGDVPLTGMLAFALNNPPSEGVKQSMKEQEISVNAYNEKGETPLHAAAKRLSIPRSWDDEVHSKCVARVIATLLEHGANPHARTKPNLQFLRGQRMSDEMREDEIRQHKGQTAIDVVRSNGKIVVTSGSVGFDTEGKFRKEASELLSMFAGAAVTYAKRVTFPGSVLEQRGVECIASFPGKYAKLWQALVDAGKAGGVSAAVVFLPFGCKAYGKHAKECLCEKLYGKIVDWGCLWCQIWMENIKKAMKLGQTLVVLYFEGQTGQGTATWDELPLQDCDPRLGRGLGYSQRGELAFLRKEGYQVVERDIRDFATSMNLELK